MVVRDRVGAGLSLRPPWRGIAVRVAGSWVAAIGLLMLGWSLRGSLSGATPPIRRDLSESSDSATGIDATTLEPML